MYKTKVEIIDVPSNKVEWGGGNVTSLCGRIALENIFKAGTAFQPDVHRSLSQVLKDTANNDAEFQNPTETTCPDTSLITDYFSRKIEYFCIGTGGIENSSPLVLSKPRNWETRLYNMVPFRCILDGDTDLTETERAKYRFRRRKKINGSWYTCYYLKKFDIGNINVEYANGTSYIVKDIHSNPVTSLGNHELKNTAIHVYYEFFLNVAKEDFKEYYKAINGALDLESKLTEFGLVVANEKENISVGSGAEAIVISELYNAELFSHVVHTPAYMDSEEASKKVRYAIFS